MNRINTTFGGDDPTWANACVGNNGSPGYWDYAKGFSQAASLLIDKVIQDQGAEHSVDELIYPVCFNMRHSVELRLKDAISELIKLALYRKTSLEFDLNRSHDIGEIWRFFAAKSASFDDRFTIINARLDTTIVDFSEIDPYGQTFRYPLNTKSQKHLVDIGIINFFKLKRSFSALENALDELHKLNIYLRDEYSFGVFTKRLSRKNIFEIASLLPEHSRWDESFAVIKTDIKKRFGIGSKELTNIINIIKTHHEFAPMIGMTVELLGITEGDLSDFTVLWFKLHNPRPDSYPLDTETSTRGVSNMLASFARDAEIRQEAWERMAPKLTPELLSGLLALFYFARSLDFSERYTHIYEVSLREVKILFGSSEDEIKSKFFHIFGKTNGIYNILRSLYFLKKREFADQLVAAHDLDDKFSWLNEARTWHLFNKPMHCGYST